MRLPLLSRTFILTYGSGENWICLVTALYWNALSIKWHWKNNVLHRVFFCHKLTFYFKWIKVWLMTAIDWKHFKIEICVVRTYLRPLWCPSFSGSCTPEFQPEKSTSKRFQYCCLKKDTFERALISCSPWVFRMLAHNEERNRCHPSTRRYMAINS